ncbi:hypothetical protein LMG9673_01099 [Ralstonia pseudosolanacearum]|nr:hypothetical protein LMG9673_01099 [Ralstonia pseudosolanacearum]
MGCHIAHGRQRAAPVDQRPRTDGSRSGGGHRTAGVVEQAAPRVQRQRARRHRAGLVAQARCVEGGILRSDQLAASIGDGARAVDVQMARLRADGARAVVHRPGRNRHIADRPQQPALVGHALRPDLHPRGRPQAAGCVVERAASLDRHTVGGYGRASARHVARGRQRDRATRVDAAIAGVDAAGVHADILARQQAAAIAHGARRIERDAAGLGHATVGVDARADGAGVRDLRPRDRHVAAGNHAARIGRAAGDGHIARRADRPLVGDVRRGHRQIGGTLHAAGGRDGDVAIGRQVQAPGQRGQVAADVDAEAALGADQPGRATAEHAAQLPDIDGHLRCRPRACNRRGRDAAIVDAVGAGHRVEPLGPHGAIDGHGARQQVELRAARIEPRAVDGDLALLHGQAGDVAQRIEVGRAGGQRHARRLQE